MFFLVIITNKLVDFESERASTLEKISFHFQNPLIWTQDLWILGQTFVYFELESNQS